MLAAKFAHGDAHALDDDRRVGQLLRGMLQSLAGCAEANLDGSAQHELWLRFGVELDPLSPTVLALGLHPGGNDPLARAIRASDGAHVVVTLLQLRTSRLEWAGIATAFVCENPSVVRAAERALGTRCPPLVCTSGWPNSAVIALLRSLRGADIELRHHGDFDEYGVGIHRYLEQAVGVRPWRYDAASYHAALTKLPRPLLPLRDPHRLGDGDLERALRQEAVAVMEESVVDDLINDLGYGLRV